MEEFKADSTRADNITQSGVRHVGFWGAAVVVVADPGQLVSLLLGLLARMITRRKRRMVTVAHTL